MSVLYIVLPLALIVFGVGIAAFVWAVRGGQFDDLDTPALRMLHDEVPVNRPRIEIVEVDIATLDVDAIANDATDHLRMSSGVAGAINRAGGESIEREAIALGPIPIGEAVATGAGQLRARWVVHGAVMGQDLIASADAIEGATRRCLEVAAGLGAKSIALPAFGAEVGGFPIAECARRMVAVTRRYAPTELDRIIFVVRGGEARQAFERALHPSQAGEDVARVQDVSSRKGPWCQERSLDGHDLALHIDDPDPP